MKVCAIVPVAPSEPDTLVERSIKSLSSLDYSGLDFEAYYVIDSSGKDYSPLFELLPPHFHIMIRNGNRGRRAGAINDILNVTEGVDCIALFDVDSRPNADFLTKCVRELKETSGALRASGRNTTIPTKRLLNAKVLVERFYALLNEAVLTGKLSMLCAALEVPASPLYSDGQKLQRAKEEWPDNTLNVFGDVRMHDLILMWIVTLEKIRHGRPLHSPVTVVFNWKKMVSYDDDGKKSLKMIYDGASFENSDEDMCKFKMLRYVA